MYTPDGWLLLKQNGHYFVFGSWSGGYLDGDTWRRNSGIDRIEEDDNYYYFYGASGSCYKCHKESEGRVSGYNHGVYEGMINTDFGIERAALSELLADIEPVILD